MTSISEYFVKAIKNEHLGSGTAGTMKFAEDDPGAWKMLLYWKIKGSLPLLQDVPSYGGQQLLYTRAWILGDKYDIGEFQDLVMLELLQRLKR